jgi:hypothetical protein
MLAKSMSSEEPWLRVLLESMIQEMPQGDDGLRCVWDVLSVLDVRLQ